MKQHTLTNLALASALWLTLLPSVSHTQTSVVLPETSQQVQIFLNAGALTSIEPLYINFHPQQITLEEENLKTLNKWIEKVKKSNVPIHVYSYATPPMARRDMTEKSARHVAMRKAFNRALDAKNALQNGGISEKMIALHAIGQINDNPTDQLRITIRNN